jgi:hypothetical protein
LVCGILEVLPQVTRFHVIHELEKKLQQVYEELEDDKVVKIE